MSNRYVYFRKHHDLFTVSLLLPLAVPLAALLC